MLFENNDVIGAPNKILPRAARVLSAALILLYLCMFLLFSFARHKMISRLQEMMQSHCAEAMSVLTATTQNTVGNASTHERHESVRIILNFLLLQLSHQCFQF